MYASCCIGVPWDAVCVCIHHADHEHTLEASKHADEQHDRLAATNGTHLSQQGRGKQRISAHSKHRLLQADAESAAVAAAAASGGSSGGSFADLHVRRRAQFRCRTTHGNWCMDYWLQMPLAEGKAAPRGDKPCPNNCSGVGNCNYDLGVCDCPAGMWGSALGYI